MVHPDPATLQRSIQGRREGGHLLADFSDAAKSPKGQYVASQKNGEDLSGGLVADAGQAFVAA